jgi:hypothetical protein
VIFKEGREEEALQQEMSAKTMLEPLFELNDRCAINIIQVCRDTIIQIN